MGPEGYRRIIDKTILRIVVDVVCGMKFPFGDEGFLGGENVGEKRLLFYCRMRKNQRRNFTLRTTDVDDPPDIANDTNCP